MKRKPWTPAEEAELRRRYPSETAAEIARDLGRGVSAIYQRAYDLGLSKPDGWASECTRKRWAEGRHENSRKAQFKPGQTPVNKGRPQTEWMPAESRKRTRATQFQAGRPAHEARNYQPIGTERITKDGALERKVSDDPSVYPAKRWVAVSRLVWEAANGPIPAGHAVVFKPGRASTEVARITPDALELLSRGELMRRNSYHTRYPKELALLIQMKGALNRKINNRSKTA
ncbi:MAG: hypothetical protein ACOH2M_33300 [Cypionkella sp.]